jgi:hypothetical protein
MVGWGLTSAGTNCWKRVDHERVEMPIFGLPASGSSGEQILLVPQMADYVSGELAGACQGYRYQRSEESENG